VKLFAIPAGDAACLVRLEGGVRDIFLAEHNVRPGCRFVQRLPFRLGIRNIVEAIRNIVGRAVILVETAALFRTAVDFRVGVGVLEIGLFFASTAASSIVLGALPQPVSSRVAIAKGVRRSIIF
jgi:hypothetical protein